MNPPEVNGLIDRARALIVAAMPEVVAVYVFGSAATGHYSAGSDLDLAVLCRRPALTATPPLSLKGGVSPSMDVSWRISHRCSRKYGRAAGLTANDIAQIA